MKKIELEVENPFEGFRKAFTKEYFEVCDHYMNKILF